MTPSSDTQPSEPPDLDLRSDTPVELGGPTARWLPIRLVLMVIGTVSLGIGVVGIFVPVLPTTPFLLLAAACYARASTRLYGWLISRPALGPVIIEWRRSRSLSPGVRKRAMVLVALAFGMSIVLVGDPLLRLALAAAGLVVAAFLYRIPTRP
jgi:hypothetical protein